MQTQKVISKNNLDYISNNTKEKHRESTAGINNEKTKTLDANVSIPNIKGVEDAKSWVDNGSRL